MTKTRATDSTGLRLLSEKIRVPVARRAGGERVPCPICSPNRPKFVIGLMAYFPADSGVRFIGHDCADTHFTDDFRQAEVRFRAEVQAVEIQALWTELAPRGVEMASKAVGLMTVTRPLQMCRDAFGYHITDFAQFLYRNRPGSISKQDEKTRKAVYSVAGLSFLSDTFRPHDKLREIASGIRELHRPLPDWNSDSGTSAALKEIGQRGQKLQAAIKALPKLVSEIGDARQFLTRESFRRIDRWHRGGSSPFASLLMELEGGFVSVQATSFERTYSIRAEVSADIFKALPTLAEVTFRTSKGNK
ncbi:hypothetical protein [Pararhizobium gei]|uniref:hypothetical protein n=1 Tax=Pararhizobium gei TaxID=1395951 RepID=UPI0023DAA772|nr:hypothetical protein [Rhizobium gei]